MVSEVSESDAAVSTRAIHSILVALNRPIVYQIDTGAQYCSLLSKRISLRNRQDRSRLLRNPLRDCVWCTGWRAYGHRSVDGAGDTSE